MTTQQATPTWMNGPRSGRAAEPHAEIVTVHANTETGEYTVSGYGFDDFSTDNEQEARDEAEYFARHIVETYGFAVTVEVK